MRTKLFVTSAAILALAIVSFMFVPNNTRTGETKLKRFSGWEVSDTDRILAVKENGDMCGTYGKGVVGPDGKPVYDENGKIKHIIFGTYNLTAKDYRTATEAEKQADTVAALNLIVDSYNAKIAKNSGSSDGLPPSGGSLITNAYAPPQCGNCDGEGTCCEVVYFPGSVQQGTGRCNMCQGPPWDCSTWVLCCFNYPQTQPVNCLSCGWYPC